MYIARSWYRIFKKSYRGSVLCASNEYLACPKVNLCFSFNDYHLHVLCSQADVLDPMIMSIEANFRLCSCINSAKKKDTEPSNSPSFFLSQKEVDCYVTSYEHPTTTEVCAFF